jgi:diguanylate cyclase (GGDEF)-like protein
MRTSDYSQSFSREALFRQIGPLVAAVLLWLVYSDSQEMPELSSQTVVWAAALIALAGVLTVLVPWHRLPRFAMLVPPLVYMVGASGFAPARGESIASWAGLFLLPVFWLSLYATGVELGAGIAAVAVAILSPVANGAGSRPDPGQALAFIALAVVLGIGSQRLFEQIRNKAGASGSSRTDALTGVASQKAWEMSLSVHLAEARRGGVPTSVAILDVDHFRAYNDRFGHPAGDRLLRFFTARWQTELRNADLLARLGGDQFGVLMPRCHLEAGGAVIRRLCSVAASTTISAGVACWNGHESLGELIGRADRALYQAKLGGRSRIVLAETPPPPAPPRAPDNRAPDIHFEPTTSERL